MPIPPSTAVPGFSKRARLAVTMMAAALLAACSDGSSQEGGKRPPPQVGFIVASPTEVPLQASLSGRTVAYETSEVRPQVSGVIRRRFFAEGSYVRAGQPLFEIDPRLYRAAANEAQANLASARASAEAARARADRLGPLAEMEAISRQDYTDALAQARVAEAAVAQRGAALETARVNMRFTSVPAPISGRIGRSLATVGALASASQTEPLAVIQRLDPMFVDMQQSAAQMTALRRKLAEGGVGPGGTEVRLLFDDGSRYPLPGTVQFSEVTVDEGTGTVTLRAKFPNPEGFLLPGMFVTATFDQASDPGAFLVPQTAVQHDFNGSAYVMLAGKDDKVVRRQVTADRTYEASAVVTSGLKRGDRLIVQGLNGLKQGAAIRPVPAATPQRPGPPPTRKPGQPGSARRD